MSIIFNIFTYLTTLFLDTKSESTNLLPDGLSNKHVSTSYTYLITTYAPGVCVVTYEK